MTSALVQKLIAAIAGPMVIMGIQDRRNKKFHMTNVGRPSVMISPRRVGVFALAESKEAGLFFFNFKGDSSLSNMFYGNNYNEEPGIFQVITPANL